MWTGDQKTRLRSHCSKTARRRQDGRSRLHSSIPGRSTTTMTYTPHYRRLSASTRTAAAGYCAGLPTRRRETPSQVRVVEAESAQWITPAVSTMIDGFLPYAPECTGDAGYRH